MTCKEGLRMPLEQQLCVVNTRGFEMLKVRAGWLPEWAGGEPTTPDPVYDLRAAADRISNAINSLSQGNRGSATIDQAVSAVNQAVSAFNTQWQQYQQSITQNVTQDNPTQPHSNWPQFSPSDPPGSQPPPGMGGGIGQG